ncbi:MAG: response regulator transcription factor [Hyphomicrobiales bacterium]|nr:response regulator transcription factor [Hyphomicrobiales bacterium]
MDPTTGAVTPPAPPDDAPHVLVVDDDTRIRGLLARFLGESGYRVAVAADAEEARAQLGRFDFDLAILDVMMPGVDGRAFARERRRLSEMPILMLTALDAADDRVAGLEAGADDYLAKPFDPRELLLRVAALLRRSAPRTRALPTRFVRFGDFAFEANSGALSRGDEELRLTDRERDLLRALALAAPDPVSRLALGAEGEAENERTIDVQINRLRRQIEADPAEPRHLLTVRGVGYRLATEGASG